MILASKVHAGAMSPDLTILLDIGLQHHRAGRLEEAKAIYLRALQVDPRCADALNFLGCLVFQQGRHQEAVDLISRAIALNKKVPAYYCNLGNALLSIEKPKLAIKNYQQAIRLRPDYAAAFNNLGLAFSMQGRKEALSAFKEAIRLQPSYSDAHFNLANAYKEFGDVGSAERHYRESLLHEPVNIGAAYNLANTLKETGRLMEAIGYYKESIRQNPASATLAYNNLGAVLLEQGKQAQAMECYREALRLDASNALAQSNLITAMAYSSTDAKDLFEECEKWDKKFAEPLRQGLLKFSNLPNPQRRLRVAYISPDFREHAVAFFIEPLLANHDHLNYEVLCYSDVLKPDEVTLRLKEYTDCWVDITGLADESVAQRILNDKVDILVDLAGHTNGNRLMVFARKPAPLQISWFGFPASTGVKTFDYRFTDEVIDVPGESEKYYVEKLVRLQRFYACYRPDAETGDVEELPSKSKGYVTFASLNNFAKVTPDMLKIWARILQSVPDSRLWIQAAGLDESSLANEIRSLFRECKIDTKRVELRGRSTLGDFLKLNREVDVVLDTFPFNGGVTTCHALWMGLPVVTLAGKSAASRIGYSILSLVGLDELVSKAPDDYIRIATHLAKNEAKLRGLRFGLRDMMFASGLLDGQGFAREVEQAYTEIWREWCMSARGPCVSSE